MSQSKEMAAIETWAPLTIWQALERAATNGPDVEAVVAEGTRVTYGELAIRVARARSMLRARGVGHGDHVALCMQNGARWVEIFLALTSIGAVVVPINTRFTTTEFEYVLRQSRSCVLITVDRFLRSDYVAMLGEIDPAILDADGGPSAALPDLREVLVVGAEVPEGATSLIPLIDEFDGPVSPPTARPDDHAVIQYTSGTTSFPKGAILTHKSMCANAYVSGMRQGLRAADRFHSVRPFFHVAGSTLAILSCIQHTATLVTMERFEAGPALALMQEERCTHFSGNDTIALMLLDHPDRPRTTLALRGAWIAASPAVIARVIDELGASECVTGYGLSESSPNIAMSRWWDPLNIRIAAAMTPQPGVEVRIVDADSRDPLGEGSPGEIEARGWNLMQGYLDDPEATAAAITPDGWLRTGDLGQIDEEGRLYFTGRVKEILRVGGENVAPVEVEDILTRHPAIKRAVVVGVPDPRLVEVPAAFVELRVGSTVTDTEVIAWAKGKMAGFKVPRHVFAIEDVTTLGMTGSNKVRRKDARERAIHLLAQKSGTPT